MESLENITLLLFKQWNEPLTEDERMIWDNWLAEDPGHVLMLDRIHKEPLKKHFEILHQYDSEKGLRRLLAALENAAPEVTQKPVTWWRPAVAAAILVVAGVGIYWIINKTASNPIVQSSEIYRTINVPKGEQSFVRLSDSTQVWLNAGSTLRYPDHFSGEQRSVELTGEAFFDVTKTKAGKDPQPFSVHLKDMDVVVSGTRFNVKAYEEDTAPNTTLLEGSVEVRRGGHIRRVEPGQQAILNTSTGDFTVTKADTNSIKSWMSDEYAFREITLPALLKDLERWYNITIIATPNDLIGQPKVNGELPKSATVKSLALIMGGLYPKLSFTGDGKKLIIKKK